MFDIGFLELMVVAVLGLLVLGPERLPKAARTVGLFVGRIRRTLNNIQEDLERQVRTEELREKLKDPYATFLDDDSPSARQITSQAPPEGPPYSSATKVQPPEAKAQRPETEAQPPESEAQADKDSSRPS